MNKLKNHIIFWVVVMISLVIGFGLSIKDFSTTFYFVSFLLPVAMGTSYLFNYLLVPKYLLSGRKILFYLYTFYLVIVALYLEMIVILGSLILLANYQFDSLAPIMKNIVGLGATLFIIILSKAFVLMYHQVRDHHARIEQLKTEKQALKKETISVKSNRKQVTLLLEDIYFLESRSDYIHIHTENEEIVTKDTLSSMEKKLPETFVRIHRSFIVNIYKMETYTSKNCTVGGQELTISRTYKANAMQAFEHLSEH